MRVPSGYIWLGIVMALAFGAGPGCKDSTELEYGHEVTGVRGDKHSTGPLEDGKKHGVWTTVENGKITDVEYWRNGVEHGPYRHWEPEGDLYQDNMAVNGKWHGRYRSFYGTGQIARLEWFVNFKRDGMSCIWNPDGSLAWIEIHEMDRPMQRVKDPPGECPLVVQEPRHLDPDDQDYR